MVVSLMNALKHKSCDLPRAAVVRQQPLKQGVGSVLEFLCGIRQVN